MKQKLFFLTLIFMVRLSAFAQMEVGPVSGNGMAAQKSATVPVNLFTGSPNISIPLFSYSNVQGLNTNLSLNYLPGGIRVQEVPSPVGLGWYLNVGGTITRSVRGIADDHPSYGFLYSGSIPADTRSTAKKYYNSCADGEQDIFHFNFNGRSGSFVIGKNRQVIVMPSAKIKIRFFPDYSLGDDIPIGLDTVRTLTTSFMITTEDGTKYFFEHPEVQWAQTVLCDTYDDPTNLKKYGYINTWYLSRIVAPFSNSTIQFKYKDNILHHGSQAWTQTDVVRGGVHYSDSATALGQSTGVKANVPSEVVFPDSTRIEFVYSYPGQFRYTTYPVLQRIKFKDSVFRYGYQFQWDTTVVGGLKRDFLSGLNYYTSDKIAPGYAFNYNSPYFPITSYWDGSNFLNKKDHWGFYNGANNHQSQVPTISGIVTGANRTPTTAALASSLSSVKDPSGGTTYYQFENNDVIPTVHSRQTANISITGTGQTSISVSRLQSPFCNFTVMYNGSTVGSPPLSGSGNMIFAVTSSDGSITYGSNTISLNELFYTRSVSVGFKVPTGSLLFKTTPIGGTSISTAMPVILVWNNQTAGVGNAELAGGIRIKQVSHYDSLLNKIDTLVTYRYVLTDGKSSGYGGTAPMYHYTRYNGVLATNETVIVDHPSNGFNLAEDGYTAYKRVEEIKGTLSNNLGKIVHEFTGAEEGFVNTDPASYPYMPVTYNNWSAGLPKRTSIYDNTGKLVQKKTNTFKVDTAFNINSQHLNIKYVAHHSTLEYVLGQRRMPFLGTAALSETLDSLFHSDNSVSVSKTQMQYDTNFNIIKVTTDYDKTRGLLLEKLTYYPYNYTVTGALGTLRDSGFVMPVSIESWITGDGNPRLLALTATEFKSTGGFGTGIIVPFKQHSLESNKPIPSGTIGTFNPAQLIRNTTYIKPQSEVNITRFGYMLEQLSAKTGTAVSNIWGYNNKHRIAVVSNARYTDIAYTSFETAESGNWIVPAHTPSSVASLTGNYSFPTGVNPIIKSGLNTATTYTLSVWAKSGTSVSCTAGTLVNTDQQNGWVFYTVNFNGVSSVDVYASGGYIDELRLHPAAASMITTTYNSMGNVTSTCDANNTVVYNEYDAIYRPLAIRDKDKNIIKKFEYPSNIVSISMTPNWVLDSSVNIIANPSNPYSTQEGNYRMCEKDANGNRTGRILLKEKDTNYYSETYGSYRYVIVETTNTSLCPLPVADCGPNPAMKSINGECELGCREYTASVHRRIYDPLTDTFTDRWDCTYHYKWSNGSISGDYLEYNSSSCYVGPCGFSEE